MAGLAILGLVTLGVNGWADASLINIGTASYSGGIYNLIYDNDSPLGPITWLDYAPMPPAGRGSDLFQWAPGVAVSVNLSPGVIASWATNPNSVTGWRLPSAGNNPQAGYNQTSSEFGHLYYTELGNVAGSGWSNIGIFNNLKDWWNWGLWTGTRSGDYNWVFHSDGYQDMSGQSGWYSYNSGTGMLVLEGVVTTSSPTPEPGTLLLFGTGITGVAGIKLRRQKRKSVNG